MEDRDERGGEAVIAIRRCKYCGEYFDTEVGDSRQYCESCQQIMEIMEEDEDQAVLTYGDQTGTERGTSVGQEEFPDEVQEVADEFPEEIEIPESAFEFAEGLSLPKPKPIDDFRGAIKEQRKRKPHYPFKP